MATEPDEEFFRNYFASYETEPSEEPCPVKLEPALENCHCVMNCYSRFSADARMQLRTWYRRLTPAGRTAFLSTHLREPSPGHNLYRLPTTTKGGDFERVCMAHFMNTLHETKERIREVILDKRKAFLPEEKRKGGLMESEEESGEDFLPDKRYRKGTKGAAMLDRIARGLSYTTRRTKKIFPARTVKAPCDSACRYKCYERFTLEERQQKLKDLLQMPLAKQHKFLTDHACKLTPVRKKKPSNGSRLTIYYFFREGRKLHRVCKTMFLNTYDITNRRFGALLDKKGANAHVICGNPKLAGILKKYRNKWLVFDVDEGFGGREVVKKEVEEFRTDKDCVNEEETELEEGYDEITIEYGTIKQEFDETEQEILPDGPPASSNGTVQAESVQQTIDSAQYTDKIGAPSTVWIKTENMECDEPPTQDIKRPSVDIKAENVELEERLVVPLTRCDDLVDKDSNREPEETSENDSDSESVTSKKGKKRTNRVLKPHCGTKCNMQCYTRVSDELRTKLLANLLQMSSSKQRKFIANHICVTPSVRLRSKESRRRFSNFYFLPVESRLVKVCKLMFCSTYGLSFGKMRDIILEKADDKRMVCGNPNFPAVLKKDRARYYFDYNEGCEQTSEEACRCSLLCHRKISNDVIERLRSIFQKQSSDEQHNFLSKYIQLPPGNKIIQFRARFFLPLESPEHVEQVCRKMFLFTFKLNWSFVRVLLDELETTNTSSDQAKAKRRRKLTNSSYVYAKEHIATYRMDEDHHCKHARDGVVRKLSRCPNPVQMYNEYLERLAGQQQQQAIEYQLYFGMFIKCYSQTGLVLPTRCPDCGFFSRTEVS